MNEIQLSVKAKKLKKGYYKHYKGSNYLVLDVVIHSETLEELVLYKALYGEGLTWVRPLDMFMEEVSVKGKKHPRFQYLGKKP